MVWNFWLQKNIKIIFPPLHRNKCTISSVKILHRIIVHGKSLFNMKLILSSINCIIYYEIYSIHLHHGYFLCSSIQIFWGNLIFLWQQQIKTANHLTTKDAIFGCYIITEFLSFTWKMFYPFNSSKIITWQTSSVYCFLKWFEK